MMGSYPNKTVLTFCFQASVFIAGNKQGVVRALRFRED